MERFERLHTIHGYAAMKDGRYHICTRTASETIPIIKLRGEHVMLNLHAPRGEADIKALQEAYRDWIPLANRVEWDTESPDGMRSHVRSRSFMIRRKIVTGMAYVYDDDYKAFIEFRPEEKPERPVVGFNYFLDRLNAVVAEFTLAGILVTSVSESDNYMTWGPTPKCAGRSGLWVENHKRINLVKAPDWDMYDLAKELNMITNEDILASLQLILTGEFRLTKGLAVLGNRESNDPMDMVRAESATALLCALPKLYGYMSLRTKFSYDYGIQYSNNPNIGWLECIKEVVRDLKKDLKLDILNYYLHRDEIWRRAALKAPETKNPEFANVYKQWLKEQEKAA